MAICDGHLPWGATAINEKRLVGTAFPAGGNGGTPVPAITNRCWPEPFCTNAPFELRLSIKSVRRCMQMAWYCEGVELPCQSTVSLTPASRFPPTGGLIWTGSFSSLSLHRLAPVLGGWSLELDGAASCWIAIVCTPPPPSAAHCSVPMHQNAQALRYAHLLHGEVPG